MKRSLISIFALVIASAMAWSQQNSDPLSGGDRFENTSPFYNDQTSNECSKNNTSPFAGMDPLSCHGVMAPADSRGGCTLRGMRLFRRQGLTCYYCKPINPPIKGIVIPLDQISSARAQGFDCAGDQSNPACMAVCTGQPGAGLYIPPTNPPLRGSVSSGGNVPRNRYGLPRPVSTSSDACLPFGPGGYDYCANPTQPAGCDCSKRRAGASASTMPQACAPDPDWVRNYKAQGADPPIQYQVGFNQGVARCLESQCTLQNLAIAIWASAFQPARALLAVSAAPGFINAVVHPPGFSLNPDPYLRGKAEGSRLCNWVLQLAAVANARRSPLVRPGGRISIPSGFNFYEAVQTMPRWITEINTSGSRRNCGPCTANLARVLLGQPLEAAPDTTSGWTDAQMEADLGTKFNARPLTDQELFAVLNKMPEGTVGVIGAENPSGPGHFFAFVKANNNLQFSDVHTGGEPLVPAGWTFSWTAVGNALNQ
jgi:Papain fold toxin 1, glutamine deamidase